MRTRNACPSQLHALTSIAVAIAAGGLVLSGCSALSGTDTAPSFGGVAVDDRTYATDQAIEPLELPAAAGGDGALTYSLDPDVPGLTFDQAPRTLGGTPTQAGTYAMTYTVVDADDNTDAGDADTIEFTITVQVPAPTDTAPSFGGATVDDRIYAANEAIPALPLPPAAGGNGALTYSLEPEVPGLTFDQATRTLNGTPTQTGAYAMTYTVVDDDANTTEDDADTIEFTITVQAPAPIDTAPSFGSATVNDRIYAANEAIPALSLPAAAGGNGALTYALEPEVPGLAFDQAIRTLGGTPTQAGTYRMTYTVVDADGNTDAGDADTIEFTITVQDTAPSFGGAAVDDRIYAVDQAIAALPLPAATGGDGPLTYTLEPEVPGLTFDQATRTLGGTPTQAGTYRMTYTVVDADGNTDAGDADTIEFTITVQDTAPSFGGAAVDDRIYAVDQAIAALPLPAATGGDGPLTYTLEPEVPGLTFDQAPRTLDGTPTQAGTYAMTYTVVDDDANTTEDDADTIEFTITVQDTAPSFGGATVDDRTYAVGQAIAALPLPAATGGDGALTYTLDPEVPGLTFDQATRTLDGTPTQAGTYAMTYTVVDDDANTTEDDADTIEFTITVQDTAPSFGGAAVDDRTYAVGQAIAALPLPAATGGDGALTYALDPDVPGLAFDQATRTLSGTPTLAGTYAMTYTVMDADGNTDAGDADTLTFTLHVIAAASYRYRGSGDQVFVLNPDGEQLDDARYVLDLGDASAEVYLVATNTALNSADPEVERLDPGPAGAEGRRAPPRPPSSGPTEERAWITEFNNNAPLGGRSAGGSGRLRAQSRGAVAEGDRFTFTDRRNGILIPVPATARSVVTDGATTAAFWVADRDWGPDCRGAGPCVTGEMVDAMADRFFRPGAGNDIHDWVTAIYGEPWGPHRYSDLIPPEAAGEIHVLLFDIKEDGAPRPGECRTVGYFWAAHNFLQTAVSAERLIFFMDSAYFAIADGPTWDVTDRRPSVVISTLAHEFQHMIHFYQKRVLRRAASETWLNEMASEVAEDLVADKMMVSGPRGVASDDPTAGEPGNRRGRLPYYNLFNDIQVTAWNGVIANYAVNYALGAYLARTYGGAELFRAIVQSDRSGVAAIEAALAALGHDVSFGDVLADWAVATLLSDNTAAPRLYRYNPGTWSTSHSGGERFRLGSINLHHYRYEPPEIVPKCVGDLNRPAQEGPYLHSLRSFNARTQPPHSNMYATLGRNTGTVLLSVSAGTGNRITVVVKE